MRFIDFIIAEDIRFETGNKYSVMGIYSEVIGLNLQDNAQWPIAYRFGIYIRLEIEDSDHVIPNRFSLKVDHNGNNIAVMDGDIHVKTAEPISMRTISLPLVLYPFPLPGPGIIRFNCEIYNNEELLNSETHELLITIQSKN